MIILHRKTYCGNGFLVFFIRLLIALYAPIQEMIAPPKAAIKASIGLNNPNILPIQARNPQKPLVADNMGLFVN